MVHCCAAYNCTERYKKGGVSFHSFPTDKDLREKWTKAVRRLNYKPSEYSKLCAKHFTSDCYETAPWSYMKRLKEGAVPTIFQFSPVNKKKYQKKSIRSQDDSCNERYLEEPCEETLKDVTPSDSSCGTLIGRTKRQTKAKYAKSKAEETKDAEEDTSAISIKRSGDLILDDSCSLNFDTKCVKLTSDEMKEVPLRIVTDKSVSSLPAKRCRKKKTFFGDFISEDWTSLNKGRKGIKVRKRKMEPDVNIMQALTSNTGTDTSNQTDTYQGPDSDSDKPVEKSRENSAKTKILNPSGNTLKEKHFEVLQAKFSQVSNDYSSISSKKNTSEKQNGAENDVVSETEFKCHKNKSSNNITSGNIISPTKSRKCKKMAKATTQDALLVAPICTLVPLNILRHESIQETSANHDKPEVLLTSSQKKKSLAGDLDSENVTIPKKAKKGFNKALQDGHFDWKDASSSNSHQLNISSKKHCGVESVPAVLAMSNSKELISEDITTAATEQQNKLECDTSASGSIKTTDMSIKESQILIVDKGDSAAHISRRQKLSSVMKLNLDDEEAIITKCVLFGKDTTKFKLSGAKKAVVMKKDGLSNNVIKQNYESLPVPSDEKSATLANCSKRKSYIGDFKAEDLISPSKAVKCLNVAQNVIREKDKKIKYLKQRERRLMKKVEELETVIFHLVEKKMNPEEASTVLIVLKDND